MAYSQSNAKFQRAPVQRGGIPRTQHRPVQLPVRGRVVAVIVRAHADLVEAKRQTADARGGWTVLDVDVEDLARAVRVPTLVIHRRGDQTVPFERGRTLASLIPGARLLPQEGDRHCLLMHEDDRTEEFVEAIERFLRDD